MSDADLRVSPLHDRHDALGAKLLALGGKEVAWQEPEPHSQQLLSRGRLFTDPVRFCGGELNACHRNAARLWARAPDTRRIVVGYARNGDIWRQHTWVWNGKCLHETTYLFDQYFGAVLGNEEALHFWVSNIGKAGASTDLAEYNDYLDQFPALEEIMLKLILRLECRGLMKPGASPRDQARAGATGSPALQSAATL